MKRLIEHIKQLSFYDTIRHGSLYMFSYVAIQAMMVFTLPVFTKLLSPSDFGVYEVFNNTVRILGIVFSLNLFNGLYRFYFDEQIDNSPLVKFVLSTSLVFFVIFSGCIFLFKDTLMSFLNIPESLFIWLLIGVFSNIVLNLFNTYNNAQLKSTRSGIWQFFIQFFRVMAAIGFVVYFFKDYRGRILGENIILLIISFILLFFYFRKYLLFKGDSLAMPFKKAVLKYSISFIPIGLSGFALGYLDTIMINSYKGSNDAGLYSYAYKIAIIYTGITTAFVTANRPRLFSLMNDNKENEVIAQMRSMFKLIVALSCFFIFFSADGGRLLALNKSFHAGLYLMPILILSYVFNDLNELYCFYFHYEKKVKYFYFSFAVAAIINLILNILLIPKYGYVAAAYTTLISYGFMLISTYIICKYFLTVKVPAVIRFLDFILIILVALIINYLINTWILSVWLQIALKLFVFCSILLYLWRNIVARIFYPRKNHY